jgi:tetratricopeptide (TPR) repeat protein
MSPRDGHPDWNDLAALAEGAAPASADLHRHLAGCRRCAAAYAEAVRLRALELEAPRHLVVPGGLLAAARAAGPAAGARTRPRRALSTPIIAGATLAVLALVAVAIRPGETPPPPELLTIRHALLEQAPAGMVLPGLAPEAGASLTVYRDGGAGDLHDELEALAARRKDQPGAESAFWLAAGYLAAGRLQSATDLVREARRGHPEDARLLVLDAVVAYRRSDLGRAETLLREVLVRHPDHQEARFNLALLLQETGRLDEARALLESAPWRDGAWLADRAHALRDTLR